MLIKRVFLGCLASGILALVALTSGQAQAPSTLLLIRGATIIDGLSDTPLGDRSLLVEGNTIREVLPADAPAPAGARTLKWTLPSPRWPKALTLVPAKRASTEAAACVMKPAIASTATEMSCLAAGPSFFSASEMLSRRRQKSSACASLAAIAAAASSLHVPQGRAQQVSNSVGTEPPKLKAPANAADCHMHTYDPARFPMPPNPRAAPANATQVVNSDEPAILFPMAPASSLQPPAAPPRLSRSAP